MNEVVGLTHVRDCCRFVWIEAGHPPKRTLLVRGHHCGPCVAEVARSAKLQRIQAVETPPMDHVRASLAQQRSELVDRWNRQLRATAEAGFGLDPATADLLPPLLDALDRALARKYRPIPATTVPAVGDARRAAVQSSLLGDFVFDALLEAIPDLGLPEQRQLSDALAHAAVEVLVLTAGQRATFRHRREVRRLAKLAHDLRNSVTAARLAFDLLRMRGQLPDGVTARSLEASLRSIAQALEEARVDELIDTGALRARRMRLSPVLAGCASAARELGAARKRIAIQATSGRRLSVQADPRLLRSALRTLLHAAVELARPRSTIRVDAGLHRRRMRLRVTVELPPRSAGGQEVSPSGLRRVRRVARAHGGTLILRALPEARFLLALQLPASTDSAHVPLRH